MTVVFPTPPLKLIVAIVFGDLCGSVDVSSPLLDQPGFPQRFQNSVFELALIEAAFA